MLDRGSAPAQPLERPFAERRGEAAVGAAGWDAPVGDAGLRERVVERGNLLAALARVTRNGGSPGVDGMSGEGVPGHLREQWPQIREALLAGTYQPQPVKRVELPKPGGGVRQLGGPTVRDRVIQHAGLQGLQPAWDTTFSASSAGFRPGRSVHQAVAQAQRYLGEGSGWVVDLDGAQVCERVNHDQRLSLVKKRVADRRVLPRIDRSLKAGALTEAGLEATGEGTPHGGPGSPLLAQLRRDGLDTELERRGQRFVRDADDGHSSVKRVRAGQRVLARVTRFLERHRQLAVKAAKSAVDRPWRRPFLGFTVTGRRPHRRRVSDKALKACQAEVRRRTFRTRGESRGRVVGDLRRYLEGWDPYDGCAAAPSRFTELDAWLRRRLRGSLWKPWDRRRYRQRRRRGVSRELAWNTVKAAQGPWRISRSPALAIALPGSAFDGLGWPRLHRGSPR
jgi:RNA-directed DNA polymerase